MSWAAVENGVPIWKLIALGVSAVVGLLGFAYTQSEREKARRNIQRLAEALGFTMAAPRLAATSLASNRITARRGGRTVDIYTRVEDHDKPENKRGIVAMIVRNPHRLTLRIHHGLMPGLGAILTGEKPVLTGDDAFDRKFSIHTNTPAYVAAALLPEVRRRILQAAEYGFRGGVNVDIGEIRYEEKGAFEDDRAIPRLRAIVEVCSDLADIVEVFPGGERFGGETRPPG